MKPKVLFWPLGNPKLESALQDAEEAFTNLSKNGELDVTKVKKMTWWEPSEIPKIQRTIGRTDLFDALVVFSATHGTVRCIASVVKRLGNIPAIIWAIPTRYSLATSALGASYLSERGYFTRLLCNLPNDSSVRSEVEVIARAGRAKREASTRRIGLIGNLSPLMISLPYNPKLLQEKLGPKIVKIALETLQKELDAITQENVREQVHNIESKYQVKVQTGTLEKAARFQLAVRKIVERTKLDGIALECWTNLFSKYGVNPCLGHLDDLDIGCEGDVVSLSGSMILRSINEIRPYLADILSVDSKKNVIELSHCAAPVSLASQASKISVSERTDTKSKGKTAFASFDLRKGPVTLVRFYGRELDKIHMTFGNLIDTGEYWGGIRPVIEARGNASEFLKHVCGNHYLLTYGDIRSELYTFAKLKGLEIRED